MTPALTAKTQKSAPATDRAPDPPAPRVEPAPAPGMPLFLRRWPGASAEGGTAGGAPSAQAHLPRGIVIGGVDDPAEREAQQVARSIVHEPLVRPPRGLQPVSRRVLQRSPVGGASPPSATPPLRAGGPGSALSPRVRSTLEPRLGTDLSGVRVHTDVESRETAHALNARAFTLGSDIWLGRGESAENLELMAHEATHVAQQDGVLRRQPTAAAPSTAPPAPPRRRRPDEEETRAEAAAAAAIPAAAPAAEVAAAALAESMPPSPVPPALTQAELLMPEPPAELSPEEHARLDEVEQRAAGAAEATAEMPAAGEEVAEARSAVAEPEAEAAARAAGDAVEGHLQGAEPSPEIEQLCDDIRRIIRSKRPPDEESLVRAEPQEMAQEAGGQLDTAVEGDVQNVQAGYQGVQQPPTATPEAPEGEIRPEPAAVETPDIGAQAAAPDAVPAESVSLDADVAASQQRLEQSGMNSEAAQLVQTGPIAEARAAQGELEETAQRDPAEVLAELQANRATAAADMAALQQSALEALAGARSDTVGDVSEQQGQMVGSEQQIRERIGRRAQEIFDNAQRLVAAQLDPLPQRAMQRWETGVAELSHRFEERLRRVEEWIRERHSGGWGAIVSFGDAVFGLPDWVTEEYDAAEQQFGDGVCDLIREISAQVNGVIATCEAIIQDARDDIAALFDAELPAGLQEWAAQEQARLAGELDGLQQRACQTRDDFNRQLVERASQTVQEARQRVHSLREAAGGLLGRIASAIEAFIDDPVKFIIEGLLQLVGIPPASFWAVVARIQQVIGDIADDPLGFANNLLAAIAQGFSQFFGNIGRHLLTGLMDWLFAGMAAAGVTIPSDLSLKSIITFFLQLMGITWDRIRRLLVRHIGEQNVALIERAYELISTLIEQGPQGIFEMIKDRLNPQEIIDQVMQAAIEFLTQALITQAAVRIVAMLNPAGAIAQALEAIYRVLKWIFENAARIFQLVETVVNGMANIIAGNISGMATAVEGALVRIIAPVIDFLADYIGLGDLPDKIREVIERMQNWVEGILDRVIGWLAERARGLLRALGIGGEEGGEGAEGRLEEDFTDSHGSPHELTVDLSSGQPVIRVASDNPTGVQHQIEDRRAAENDPNSPRPLTAAQKGALTRAWNQHDELVPLSRRLLAAPEGQEAPIRTQMQRLMDSLAANMVRGDAWPDEEIQPTNVSFGPDTGLKEVTADPLTRRPGNTVGSAASVVLPNWRDEVGEQSPKRGGRQEWKRVHLLSDRLHGPGNNPANLVPGQELTNGALRRGPERDAYERIMRGEVLRYTARVTGPDPANPYFPVDGQGIHVTITRIDTGEEQRVFDRGIPTAPAPTNRGPKLSAVQNAVLNEIERLKQSEGRMPEWEEVAQARGLRGERRARTIFETVQIITQTVHAEPRPWPAEIDRAARILEVS